MQVDYLIVGQGLAGTLLAFALLDEGASVCVLDDGHRSAASMVAAGLINPLAGIRFNHAPQTGLWLRAAETTYRRLEHALKVQFFHPKPMLRLFRSPEQIRFFERRRAHGPDPYTAARLNESEIPPRIVAPLGGFRQAHTGFVDLPVLLAAARRELLTRGAFRQTSVAPESITWTEAGVALDDLKARALVCCTGAAMRAWQAFGPRTIAPEQGEIIDIESHAPLCTDIINGAHWLVPHSSSHYRFGATHRHDVLDAGPSSEGREKLIEGLGALVRGAGDLSITRHTAGIRPSTSDRAPLVGCHPTRRQLHSFNGFGGRGCLKAPWFAQQFAQHLVHGGPLPEDVDPGRFMR